MKSFLSILKVTAVVVCLAGAWLSWNYLSIWHGNKQAEATSVELSKAVVDFGTTFTVEAGFRVPWHREMALENKVSLPLRASPDAGQLQLQPR